MSREVHTAGIFGTAAKLSVFGGIADPFSGAVPLPLLTQTSPRLRVLIAVQHPFRELLGADGLLRSGDGQHTYALSSVEPMLLASACLLRRAWRLILCSRPHLGPRRGGKRVIE